jgi:hypothetical protein
MEGSLWHPSGYPAARLITPHKKYFCFKRWDQEEANRLYSLLAERKCFRKPSFRRCGFSATRGLHSQKKRAGHPCGDGECRPFLFPAARSASYNTDNRAHSPNTAPQTGTTVPIRSLTAVGKFAQAILARCAGALSFISARSKKRATIRISPAMITSPTKAVPQPGPGKGANKRLVTTTKIPPTITRTFRRAELPLPLRWLRRYRARNR